MQTRFERLLIDEIRTMKTTVVLSMIGTGYSKFEDYQYNLGYIHALERVIEACDRVREDLEKE